MNWEVEYLKIRSESTTPIYMQIAELIEDQILKGIIKEGEQVYSTNELSYLLHVNPATARKGLNLLVDGGIIYKKRGVGMFVSSGATEMIKEKRTNSFFNDYILEMLREGDKLGVDRDEIIKMIKSYKREGER